MRTTLDRIYQTGGWLAAATILAIALLVSTQVLLNLATRTLSLPLPSTIPSYADFSGFMLAAATFLAMPYTFRSGGHIRVGLITSRLPATVQFVTEVIVLIGAAWLVGFLCFYTVKLVEESLHFGDTSPGMVPIPLWFPQCFMALGLIMLFIAILHTLVETIQNRGVVISAGEEA